ncbi:Protein sel-1 2 [Choanephora cucurbitarum]|uniref:Protein sel-1 2 n=1 Tax=Choanephora cucurbitarum TaxID=101091 RepID=A0A1C7NCV8_9FUNG|nr:Protein sel-1 2 [Choanephora cucurbitarum]
MGNNASTNKSDALLRSSSRSKQNKVQKFPSPSITSTRISSPQPTPTNSTDQRISLQSHEEQPVTTIAIPENTPSTAITSLGLSSISENKQKRTSDASSHLNKLPISTTPDRQSGAYYRRTKPQRSGRSRDRYSSTLSVSGFSSSIGDTFHFSMVGDSTITDITNASSFSVNSFLDKVGEDNNYIMTIPDSDFTDDLLLLRNNNNNTPCIDHVSTTEDILDLLTSYSDSTYDILTSIFGSERIRTNSELQKEAFVAAETWSLRPTDVIAKVIVACSKLCGWGTTKNPKKGFNELQALADKGVWEAFYYLGQCYHYGIEQASETHNLSGRPLSTQVIQPIDCEQAIYWYLKVIEKQKDLPSDRVRFYVAEAQFRVAAINFASDQISIDNVEENIAYLKESVAAGNRKSEFSMGLLLEIGLITDALEAKEYYLRSARKGYSPAQIQLALILRGEESSESISWLSNAARLGDPRAFYHLGESYEFGKGVKADPIIAAHNYQTAAERYNHHISEFRLGMHYLHGGLDLGEDHTKAFHYLQRAANGGYADAQYLFGMMYRDGKVPHSGTRNSRQSSTEISRNNKEAFRWIRKAAAQRMHTAITQIANCYEEGVGTAVNYALAEEYYGIAVSIPGRHLPSAQQTYARFLHKNGKYEKALEMYLYASGIQSSPLNTHPPSQAISRAAKRMIALFYLDDKDTSTPYKPKEGFNILMSLAKSEDAGAHYWVAVCYEEGVPGVVDIDLSKSFEHYVISANLGMSDSQFQVGHMLCKGVGVAEDRLAAFKWFKKSAEKNNAKAMYYIGIYYYNGSGSIARNHEQASLYFKRSAELGHVESMVSYAQMCQDQSRSLSAADAKKLQAESLKWYTKSAKHNHTTALRELGRLYGAKSDFKASFEYYFKAAQLNDALSCLFLGGYYENGQGVSIDTQTALKYYAKAIELGQPTALFAIAELYEKLKEHEKAYSFYKKVIQDPRISMNFKSKKTSKLKVALYSLHYDPHTLLSDKPEKSKIVSTKFDSIPSLLSQEEAFDILLKLATEEKFPDAFNWIAECYQDARGVSQSISESIHWRVRAAQEANDLNAAMKLASMYEHGTGGVQKNTAYSYQLYQMCAERNNVISQHKLGMVFWRGYDTIPINLGMAVIWFTRSARQGYAPSHWALGQIALENGDLHIAIAWWETATKLNSTLSLIRQDPIDVDHLLTTTGDSEALVILGKIIQDQKEPVLTTDTSCHIVDQIERYSRAQQENHGLAIRCFGQAASMGNVEGMYLAAEAWNRDRDYPVALEYYEKAASRGHIPSRIMCATYQIYGLGGKRANPEAGYKELLKCSRYNASAFVQLGKCYEQGLGTPKDIDKARELYHMSIEETNSSESMFRIGQMCSNETADGKMEALYWYRCAVNRDNHPRANYHIGLHDAQEIQNGHSGPDMLAAVQHLRAAAKQGEVDAMFELGQLLLMLINEKCAMFPVDLQAEGINWYEAAADLGSCDAHRELGNLYHTGRDESALSPDDSMYHPVFFVPQDFERAFDHFGYAAHLGDKTSALFLGTYYEHGICVPPNLELAETWYTSAIKLGAEEVSALDHPSGWWPAQLCLARVLHQNEETRDQAYTLFKTVYTHKPEQHLAYLEMILAQYELYGLGGVPVQAEDAVAKLLKLAEEGYLKAFFPIAQCYEHGIGIEKDLSKALQWYVLLVHSPIATDQDTLDTSDHEDLSNAYFCLAEYYRQGVVVEVDLEKSDMLYRISAERGCKKAKYYLSSCCQDKAST